MSHDVDISGLQPEAREIVRPVGRIVVEHLGDQLITLVAHGSAVKGGFIAGCSDVDLTLLVVPSLLDGDTRQLPLALAYPLYGELSGIDLRPFRYLQVYTFPSGEHSSHRFIPGAYHIVAGDPHVNLTSAAELRRSAHDALASLDPAAHVARISRQLLGRGSGAHSQELRYLCTDVWPVLYHTLTISEADPLAVWRLPKTEAIALTDAASEGGQTIRAFYAALLEHYAGGEALPSAYAAIEAGLAFLRAAATSYGQARRAG